MLSQTQVPPLQRLPTSHMPLLPHRQEPDVEHESARAGSQATQISPLSPHLLSDRVWHPDAEQQPSGHEVESHEMQAPPMQVLPDSHMALLPQRHEPLVQLSALSELHCVHGSPAVSQRASVGE